MVLAAAAACCDGGGVGSLLMPLLALLALLALMVLLLLLLLLAVAAVGKVAVRVRLTWLAQLLEAAMTPVWCVQLRRQRGSRRRPVVGGVGNGIWKRLRRRDGHVQNRSEGLVTCRSCDAWRRGRGHGSDWNICECDAVTGAGAGGGGAAAATAAAVAVGVILASWAR